MTDFSKISFASQIFRKICDSSFITATLVIFLTMLLLFWKYKSYKYKFPPGPVGVPLLGYLPFLGSEPFRVFDRLKQKYGNVFSLYMGPAYVVVLGDYEAMKDSYSNSATLDKPPKLFDFLPDAVGFSSNNGEEWVEQRRFCVRIMRDLGLGKDRWESMIQAEVEEFVNLVSSFKGQPVDIFDSLTSSVSNNITAFVFGSCLPYDHPDRKLLDSVLEDAMESFDQAALYNFYPILREVSVALGIGKAAKAHRKLVKFNNFVRKEVEKMKLCYKTGEHENFIVDYLKAMDSNKDKPGLHGFTDRNLYGNTQGLFLGGSDTTRNSIHWLLLIMAEHQDIQNKVQKEVDSVLGKDRRIQWSERKELPFTIAVIMEGQRWRSIAPMSSARMATEDIKIQGYDILKGTTILVNNWGLHNDKRYWKDPEKFCPERFLTEDGKEVRKPESYNPFSYGRRNCPGETIAMMDILLYFSALMQKFTVMPPKNKKINFNGKMGLTYQAENQDLIFIPRE